MGTTTGMTATGPWRILLAEDETVNRMAALALLRRAGHAVVAVEDGPAAVAAALAAGAEPFDLILMDLGLPGFDGDEAVRRIRAHPAAAPGKTRILMLSATATPAGMERCRSCGADGVLTKPLRLDALEAALRDAAPPVAAPVPDDAFNPEAVAQLRELLPPARVADLLVKTVDSLRQYRAALDDALAAGDRAAIGVMAHKMAGVSGQYGCVALRRAAQALEAAAEAGQDTSGAFATLDAAFGPALRRLAAGAGTG